MENKTKIWKRTARFAKRLYHTLNNYRDRTKDIDFRSFSTLEYASVSPEEVKDLKRLNYIKRLDLAKNGYIDKNLKDLLIQKKETEQLMRHDHKIVPIGSLKVLENENLLGRVQLGFGPGTKSFFMAGKDHDNIPLWKNYDGPRLGQLLSAIHPSVSNALRFQHTFLAADGISNLQKDKDLVSAFYNRAIQKSFRSNPYFRASLLSPSEEVLSNPDPFVGKQFHLPISEGESTIMTLTEATARYLVFQSFLETAPKSESLYFSTQEFRQRFLDSSITLIAHLKHDLQLGTHKGILYIGKKETVDNGMQIRWETYEKRMQTMGLSSQEKYYLSKEVITKKNFVVEKDAIVLRNGRQTAYLKKHYGSGEWHYAQVQKNKEQLNFRPVDQITLSSIRSNYAHCDELKIVVEKFKTNTEQQSLKI